MDDRQSNKMNMRVHCWILVSLSIFLWGCPESGSGGSGTDPDNAIGPTRIIEFRPDIKESGRIETMARQPASETTFLAGGETGGMFRTTDQGQTWKHIDAFPGLYVQDIEWLTPGVVIATVGRDFRTDGSWAYRSVDGGLTWAPCQVEARAGCETPMTGRGLAVAKSLDVFVLATTSCGIVRSDDFGNTWEWVYPAQGNTGTGAIKAWGNRVIAVAPKPIVSTDYGVTWSPATEGESFNFIEISPLSSKVAFATHNVSDGLLHGSSDGGMTWVQEASIGNGSRPPFLKLAMPQNGISMLYFSNGIHFFRRKVELRMSSYAWKSEWEQLALDHVDITDIVFGEDGHTPLLISGDGGVFKTTDGGASWIYTGFGENGLHALQITDITGQIVQGLKNHTDLYFGTQDNHLHASSDGGASWTFSKGSEGCDFQIVRRGVEHIESRLVGLDYGPTPNYYFMSEFHFRNDQVFPHSPDLNVSRITHTAILLPNETLLEWIPPSTTEPNCRISLSTDHGQTWKTMPLGPFSPKRSLATVAGDPDHPVVYQTGVWKQDNESTEGLLRVHGFETGVLKYGFTPLEPYRLDFASRFGISFGAGGQKGNMLIATSEASEYAQMSVDSGKTWWDAKELTRAATENGKFNLHRGMSGFISAVAWDPDAPCQILVGTMQNGIIRSIDGGNHWAKIPGSEQILFPSSFFFFQEDSVAVSTFGRGLWLIDLGGRPTACNEVRPPIQIRHNIEDYVVLFDGGQQIDLKDYKVEENCKGCDLFTLRGGRIASIQMKSGKVDAVDVTSGITEWTPARSLPTLGGVTVRESSRATYLSRANAAKLPALQPGERITGVYMRDNAIVAYRVTVPSNKAEYREPLPQLTLLRQGKLLADPVLERGEPLEISGTGFVVPPSPSIVLRIEGRSDSLVVVPRRTGGINTKWPITLRPGQYTLSATQSSKGSTRIAKLEFWVPLREGE